MDRQLSGIYNYIQPNTLDVVYIITRIIINLGFLLLLIFTIYYLINIGNKHVLFSKKIQFAKKHYSSIILIIILLVLLLILYYFRDMVFTNLKPIIWAIILAYLLNPIANKLMELNISRLWSVAIIYLCIISLIILFTFIVTPRITKEIKGFVEVLPRYTNESFEFLNRIYERYVISMDNLPREFIGVEVALRDYLNNTQMYIIDFFRQITEKGLNFFSSIVSIVLIPIYTFYFLKDSMFFKRKLILAVPTKTRSEVISVMRDIDKLLGRFIRGQLLVAAIVGIMSIIVLVFLKVNFAFLIGIVAGFTNIIPYFGPIIGAIPAMIIALLDEPIKGIWVVIAFFVIQQIESAILSPKIVGDSVGLHPVIVIISLLIGGELFGLIGLLFAIPITASIKIMLDHIAKALIKI